MASKRYHLKRGLECSSCDQYVASARAIKDSIFICKSCQQSQIQELSRWESSLEDDSKVATKKRGSKRKLPSQDSEASNQDQQLEYDVSAHLNQPAGVGVMDDLIHSSPIVSRVLNSDVMCDSRGILRTLSFPKKFPSPKRIVGQR